MSKLEYRAALGRLGLTHTAFCLALGANRVTGWRWLNGVTPVPGPVAGLLRLATGLGLSGEELMRYLER